ncbi:hypothetical protein ACSTDR_22010, partial [Vibrio vulnificus]|uniref:hypothetical protein n=1 Tax=Vibrio vulnificus TaxID=672 RepID=UPI003ED955BF
ASISVAKYSLNSRALFELDAKERDENSRQNKIRVLPMYPLPRLKYNARLRGSQRYYQLTA